MHHSSVHMVMVMMVVVALLMAGSRHHNVVVGALHSLGHGRSSVLRGRLGSHHDWLGHNHWLLSLVVWVSGHLLVGHRRHLVVRHLLI